MIRFTLFLISMVSLCGGLTLSMPFDDPQALEKRCGNTLAPNDVFLLKENDPNANIIGQNSIFQVSQQAGKKGGSYLLASDARLQVLVLILL
jgi:hypothetical protein